MSDRLTPPGSRTYRESAVASSALVMLTHFDIQVASALRARVSSPPQLLRRLEFGSERNPLI